MATVRVLGRFLFDLALAIFFVILAVQLIPIRGWEFTTIFCCVFATISIVNVVRMVTAYYYFIKMKRESRILNDRIANDDELQKTLEELIAKLEKEILSDEDEDEDDHDNEEDS